MCDFEYVTYNRNSNNATPVNLTHHVIYASNFGDFLSKISSFEYVLLVWIGAFALVEVKQFLDKDEDSLTTTSQDITRYFRNVWNYFDIIGCALFLIGILFRILSYFTSYAFFVVARLLLCFFFASNAIKV